MVSELRTKIFGALLVVSLVAGCGSGSGGSDARTTSASPPAASITPSVPTLVGTPTSVVPTTTQGNPCADAKVAEATCSNREVTATNCDGSQGGMTPSTVESKVVRLAEVVGTLTIRKANPAQCAHIMWARFEPNEKESRGAFTVTAEVDSTSLKADQPSEPGNSRLSAWTEGLFVPVGGQIRACLNIGPRRDCVRAISV